MQGRLAAWEQRCASSRTLRFVDINLRGTGQVMLQNNPFTGALFLAAIAWGSFVARTRGAVRRPARAAHGHS